MKTEYHLSDEVANFVDVVHTNGGTRKRGGFGLISAVGHADFFPNGGLGEDCEGLASIGEFYVLSRLTLF
jgi:hypothetical protein